MVSVFRSVSHIVVLGIILNCNYLVDGKDDVHLPFTIKRLAFGSCADQKRPRVFDEMFKSIIESEPDAWIWTGDVIYPEEWRGASGIEDAYAIQTAHPRYIEFKQKVKYIDGVYDDHDYGLNDGGGDLAHKHDSLRLFQDFLELSNDDPRRRRSGAYTSHSYGSAPHDVKVIIMDTRFNRDHQYFKNLKTTNNTIQGGYAGFCRFMRIETGIGADYDGDILGEEQWSWLEDQLETNTAAVTILVSSIQILSPLPPSESWGHFPMAKERLFNLLQKTKPRGLIFLSGDIHLAHVAGDVDRVVEITSSGLTHSSAEWTLWPFVYYGLIKRHIHKMPATIEYFRDNNFGVLDFEFTDLGNNVTETVVVSTIMNKFGEPRIVTKMTFRSDDVSERYNILTEYPRTIKQRSKYLTAGRTILFGAILFYLVAVPTVVVICIIYFTGLYFKNSFLQLQAHKID